jgi:hypothetical protein
MRWLANRDRLEALRLGFRFQRKDCPKLCCQRKSHCRGECGVGNMMVECISSRSGPPRGHCRERRRARSGWDRLRCDILHSVDDLGVLSRGPQGTEPPIDRAFSAMVTKLVDVAGRCRGYRLTRSVEQTNILTAPSKEGLVADIKTRPDSAVRFRLTKSPRVCHSHLCGCLALRYSPP